MSRIQLKKLLNLTEQAPQAPIPDLGAPQPATGGAPQPQGMNASDGQEQPETPPATPDTSPEPEDPGEYDFTRDFRAFEDKKNKAESEAKKDLLDKMNERLLNKTIVANASRGYGQPKTDYTIENVKKISVEFWYKDYVVIVTDENDKKYFLTPGINVKIESGGSEPAPGGNEQPPVPGQEEPEGGEQPPAAGQEAPNGNPPSPEPQGVTPQEPEAEPATSPQPAPQAGKQAPTQAPAGLPVDPKKKKKKLATPGIAEQVQKDLNGFFKEFMNESIQNQDVVDFKKYIEESFMVISEGKNLKKISSRLIIPECDMARNFEARDIKLSAVDYMRNRNSLGQYTRGSVNINKFGRYYLLEYVKEIGWDK